MTAELQSPFLDVPRDDDVPVIGDVVRRIGQKIAGVRKDHSGEWFILYHGDGGAWE